MRFNDQQDFMFVRLDAPKTENGSEAALQQAAGGIWVGEYLQDGDDLKVMVFVNAMRDSGLTREEVVDALNRTVSKLTRTLEAQLDSP